MRADKQTNSDWPPLSSFNSICGTAYLSGHNGEPAKGVLQAPYKVPYDALLPKRRELTNVLVPVACSSSHVRINAVRMEPAWAIQSHAAGSAAALALQAGTPVHDVDVPALQALLLAQKQKLEP